MLSKETAKKDGMCVYKSNSNNSNPSFIFERTVQEASSNDLFLQPPVSASNTSHSSRSNSFYNLQTISPIPISGSKVRTPSLRKNSNNVSSPLGNVIPTSRSASNSTTSSLAHQEYILNPICNMQNHHHRRRTLENSVAPALDASCSIVNDENTDLSDVDMVYSRRPSSAVSLNMALLARTNSATLPSSESSPASPDLKLSRSHSHSAATRPTLNNINNTGMTTTTSNGEPNSRILRFYSYVDMLNDEKLAPANNTPTSRPPMKSQAYSCPFILKRSPPQAYSSSSATTTFSNPFIKTTELPASSPYVSPQQSARRYSNNANNNAKSPKNRSSSILFQRQSILSNVDPVANMHKNPKFQIESSDSEEEDLTMDMLDPSFPLSSSLRSSANLASNPELATQTPLSTSSSYTAIGKPMPLSTDPSYVSSSNTLSSDHELRVEKVSEVLKKKVSNGGFSTEFNSCDT